MGNRLKTGDTVIVLSGKDKGKKGKIISIFDDGVIVEKVNVAKKHQKATKAFQGGIIEKPMAVDPSRVMLMCPKCSKAARVKFDRIEGRGVRKCVKCNEVVDKVK
ncbi:MAG: 50S ribosomal protein L24 [bacterium]